MKIKFDWPHIRFVIGCVLIAGLGVYEHSPLFGNPHPTAPTLIQGLMYAGAFAVAFYGLLARSPMDVWKIAQGELLEVLGGGQPPTASPPASPNSTPTMPTMTMPPSPPPAAARRVLAWVWCSICACLLVVVLACTPTKLAAGITLGSTAACVFMKIDAGEAPEKAAADCNVSADDVFQLISLFDKRAAARRICGPAPDGGTP